MPTANAPDNIIQTNLSRRDGQRCAAQHFGAWSIEPKWFKAAADAIRAGTWKAKAFDDWDDEEPDSDAPGYTIKDGVAIICIDGQMTKRGSSFGGCSTVQVRDAIRRAAADWQVKSIALHICSPGGTVAGTADLADDVAGVRAGKFGAPKSVVAYIADMGCSAAYWVASQCETIYANKTAIIGSIGTYTVLEDDTGYQEQWGLKYRVVSTGPYKGLGGDGKVSDELIADVQREVNELNQPFLTAVSAGRGKKIPDIAAVSDGRAYVSEQAKSLGLIDEIASLDAAIEAISKRSNSMTPTEQVKQIAAEHPEAVVSFREEGKKVGVAEGRTEERARVTGILEANGLKDHAAAESITSGDDIDTAKRIAAAGAKARAEAEATAKAQAEKHAAELAEAKKAAERTAFEGGGQRPVGTGAAAADAVKGDSKSPERPDTEDPKALKEWGDLAAAHEWDNDAEKRKGYSTKERFVAIRSRELIGQHKTLTK